MSTFDLNAPEEESAETDETAMEESETATDSTAIDLPEGMSDDPKKREYYLQQLPFEKEDIDASNVIIVDGLYNMAMIYKDLLEDLPLSIDGFETLENRFPEHKYLLESYYQIYLMALKLKDHALAETYQQKLMRAFPESDYAIAVSDPNYEYKVRNTDRIQDSLYTATYDKYLACDTVYVRKAFVDMEASYPMASLMPKFMFLRALTYVQAGDVEGFKLALKALLDKYPKADVAELAGEMLKGVLRGRSIVKGDMSGMKWNLRFGAEGGLTAADSARVFKTDSVMPHRMLFIYPTKAIDKNQLLFAVAAYNFANFMVKQFDIEIRELGEISMLHIQGFINFEEIRHYYEMIYGNGGYAKAIDSQVAIVPISNDNFETLMSGKTLEEYINFFAKAYGVLMSNVLTRWEDVKKAESKTNASQSKPKESEQTTEQTDSTLVVAPSLVSKDTIAATSLTPAIPIVDSVSITTQEVDSIQLPQDTVSVSATPKTPTEEKVLTLKEIEAIRQQEAKADDAEKAKAREAFKAQQKAEKEMQERIAKEQADLLKKQKEEEEALLKAKQETEKRLAQERKDKLKKAAADRKAKEKVRKALLKQKEREYKELLKKKEAERKQQEKEYKEKLKAKEEAQKQKRKEAEAKRRSNR